VLMSCSKAVGRTRLLMRAITIQIKAIPVVLSRRWCYGGAWHWYRQNASFTLTYSCSYCLLAPSAGSTCAGCETLVITPTRELLLRLLWGVQSYSRHFDIRPLRSCSVVWGLSRRIVWVTRRWGLEFAVSYAGVRLIEFCITNKR